MPDEITIEDDSNHMLVSL